MWPTSKISVPPNAAANSFLSSSFMRSDASLNPSRHFSQIIAYVLSFPVPTPLGMDPSSVKRPGKQYPSRCTAVWKLGGEHHGRCRN